MKKIYRFITPHAIKYKAREKLIMERTKSGHRGPIGAIRLTANDTVDAFLTYFDMLGAEGYTYSGLAEDPDLPYGGVHVFWKEIGSDYEVHLKSGIEEIKVIDEQPLTNEEMYNREKERLELLSQTSDPRTIPTTRLNDELMRRDEPLRDPDEQSDVLSDIVYAVEHEEVTKDVDPKKIRFELYKQYKEANPTKKAVWQGKETKGFKDWLSAIQEKWAE